MSAPAVIVRLELEHAPVVYWDVVGEGEMCRLVDWLERHPNQLNLVERAREIAERERAA